MNDLGNFGQRNDIEFIILVLYHVFKSTQWYLYRMRLFLAHNDRHFYRVEIGWRRHSASFSVQVRVNLFLDRKSLDELTHIDANEALWRSFDLPKEYHSGVEQIKVIARLFFLPRIVQHNLIFVLLLVLTVFEVDPFYLD